MKCKRDIGGVNISFSEVLVGIIIAVIVLASCCMMLNSVINWYFNIKGDYLRTLEAFFIVNYIRHDFYSRGISEIVYISPQSISFKERIKTGVVKSVKYKVLDYNGKCVVERQASDGKNYFGPFKEKIEFEDGNGYILIKSYIGKFILPKKPVDKVIRKLIPLF